MEYLVTWSIDADEVFQDVALKAIADDLADDLTSREAYVANAQVHLDLLSSTIHDGLTGKNDLMLKVSLLADLEAAQANLEKALLE